MQVLLALVLCAFAQSDIPDLMSNEKAETRLYAVKLAGAHKMTATVGGLIARLENPQETAEIKSAAQESLVAITERADLKDAAAWRTWWNAEGRIRFPPAGFTPEDLMKQIAATDDKNLKRVTQAQAEVRSVAITLAVVMLLFIFVMFFFVGHVSSKIKGWRELVSRAEIYIKHSQELTERTDRITAELDAKKAELSGFVDKIRKEHEEGISRHGDGLVAELAHRLRMELQTLRQKADAELAQTMTDLKVQLETAARRASAEVRDRLAK